jgi:hypothetical protein
MVVLPSVLIKRMVKEAAASPGATLTSTPRTKGNLRVCTIACSIGIRYGAERGLKKTSSKDHSDKTQVPFGSIDVTSFVVHAVEERSSGATGSCRALSIHENSPFIAPPYLF